MFDKLIMHIMLLKLIVHIYNYKSCGIYQYSCGIVVSNLTSYTQSFKVHGIPSLYSFPLSPCIRISFAN